MKRFVAASLILCVFCSIGYCAKPSSSKYLTEPFDTSIQQLPKGFHGHDLVAVINATKTLNVEKKEFESTKEFTERKNALLDKKIIRNVKLRDKFAFVYFEPKKIGMTYNADSERMTIGGYSAAMNATMNISFMAIGKESYYTGQNAFGAKVRVLRQTGKEYYLRAGCYDYNNRSTGTISTSGSFHVAKERAARAKSSTALLFIGKLHEPYLEEHNYNSGATFDNPYERKMHAHILVFKIDEVWAFNASTGEIYSKSNLYQCP